MEMTYDWECRFEIEVAERLVISDFGYNQPVVFVVRCCTEAKLIGRVGHILGYIFLISDVIIVIIVIIEGLEKWGYSLK